MRRSQAARYARWSAAIALLLASITAGVYLKRDWQRHVEQKKAPPPPPVNVEKQSSGLTFSKMDGPRKIFTVEASKSTDFKDQDTSLLENVKVTIFGQAGDRRDVIHTQSCQYGKEKGAILCDGAVQIDLQSAADAENASKNPAAAPQIVSVETRAVRFDRESGDATTQQAVSFTFPTGRGQAVGARYNSAAGTLHLVQDVHLDLQPPAPKGAPAAKAPGNPGNLVHVNGTSLDFARDARLLQIAGPADAQSASAHLTAGQLTLELDAAFRARRLTALPGADGKPPELTSRATEDAMTVVADKLTAEFAPEGWVTRIDGTGSVHGARHAQDEDDEFHGDAASLDMWPTLNRAKELNVTGGVFLKTRMSRTGDARVLQTGALRLQFTPGQDKRASKPSLAETLTAGTMEWTDAPPHPGDAPGLTRLQGDKLRLAFNDQGKPKQLDAAGHVRTERTVPGRPAQTATANSGAAQLIASGGWSQIDLQDAVNLQEADRTAQADHATFLRAAQSALLTGHAVARDAATETYAPRLLFYQSTGDIRAEGGVRSTDFSPSGRSAQPAQAPANITADNLQANSKNGRALYTGHARLWQADSVLEADSIELLRQTKVLNAAGNVRGVFPQAAAASPAPAPAATAPGLVQASAPQPAPASAPAAAGQSAAKNIVLWHVTAGTLTYNDITSTAHLEKNVVVQSPDQRIRAPQMDLYFTRGTPAPPSLAGASATNLIGAQQISRAVGTGGVLVDQHDRRASAARGEYTAADGKFVMTGGDPTLYDSTEGITKGRQLTFFLADDTIIVDSENGSRTLTKHRVNH